MRRKQPGSLGEFPPMSKLDRELYGNQNSSITKEHIRDLDGLTIEEAIKNNWLFILDHHDVLMPYLRRINTTATKIYATRTILFLENNGTLKPLAIELSLPHPDEDQLGAISTVYTLTHEGAVGTIWQLDKAYVVVNDSGYHQLICHFYESVKRRFFFSELHTHAAIEPFIIATNRQLSVLHAIHKLLHPHFRDTMNINALARQTLINAGGLLEMTVFPTRTNRLPLTGLRYGQQSKCGLGTIVHSTTKLTKWFKKTTRSTPGGKKCGKKVMATKSTSPGGLKRIFETS
ncbi:hypothetical protein LguiB_021053 [Lonicera macranthoides]